MGISINNFTEDVAIISGLPDQPTLDATALKGKFDEASGKIKTYLNNILIPALRTAQSETDVNNAINAYKAIVDVALGNLNDSITSLNGTVTTLGNTVTGLQGSITSLGNRVSSLENSSSGTHTPDAITIQAGTKDYEDTVKKNNEVSVFCNVLNASVPSGGHTKIGTLASGFRPANPIKRKVYCGSNSGGGSAWFSDLYLYANGEIHIDNQSGFTANNYDFDITYVV